MNDRVGHAETSGVDVPVFFSAPPEFGGWPGFWSPEQLLVLAAGSCYLSTLLALAEHNQLALVGYHAGAEGRIEPTPGQGYKFTEIVLRPVVTVRSENDLALAHKLVEKAERVCIVSRSLAVPVRVEARVEVVAPAPVG
jgi:peroxiredoxin-like protein